MRDGLAAPGVCRTASLVKREQRRHTDPEAKRKEKKMLDKARKRGYIFTKFVGIIHFYVDDSCETAATQELARRASSRMAKTCAWLGLQDAARKRREPSVHAGAWAGSVVHVEDDAVYKLVTQERWDKTKAKIDLIWKEVQDIRVEPAA
jgi:hypothetical protein